MKRYLEEVNFRIRNLEVKIVQIPREENECADRLAKAASAEFMLVPEQVLSFVQVSSLINEGMNVQEVDSECNWTAFDILSKDWIATKRGRSRKEIEVPSIAICANKRCALQKRILTIVPKAFEL